MHFKYIDHMNDLKKHDHPMQRFMTIGDVENPIKYLLGTQPTLATCVCLQLLLGCWIYDL